MTFKPKDLNSRQKALQNIESCLIDIVQWMNTTILKLNAENTEVILFMPKRNNNAIDDICITVGDSVIKPTTSVRNLVVILDSDKIRQYITDTSAKSLVNSLVTSRLD